MNALKNTAFIETSRLRRVVPTQQRVVKTVEDAATDFLCAYPELPELDLERNAVFVAIGSERGFCGDYNEAIASHASHLVREHGSEHVSVIAIGRRLAPLLESRIHVREALAGPAVTDDIPAVLERLMSALQACQAADSPFLPLALHVVHHEPDGRSERIRHGRPLPALAAARRRTDGLLRLNLAPQVMLKSLIEQYLLASLQEMLYSSLLAENDRRLQHLEGALRRIDQRRLELESRRNVLRQEEITEEIEVILLSTTGGTDEVPPLN